MIDLLRNIRTLPQELFSFFSEYIERLIAVEGEVDELQEEIDGLSLATQSGFLGYLTRDDLYADLNPLEGALAEVVADPNEARNGTYVKVGGTGSGYWQKSTSDMLARIRALEQDPDLVFSIIGPDDVISPTYTIGSYSLITVGTDVYGNVTQVSVNVESLGSDGQLRIQMVTRSPSGVFRVVWSSLVVANTVGINTYFAGADFPECTLFPGCFIAAQSTNTGASIRYSSSNGPGYYYFFGVASVGVVAYSTTAPPAEIYYNIGMMNSPTKAYAEVGPVYTASGLDYVVGAYSLYNIQANSPGRVLGMKILIQTLNSGAIKIQHYRLLPSGDTLVLGTYDVTAVSTGENIFLPVYDFPFIQLASDERLGVLTVVGGAVLSYTNTVGAGYKIFGGGASGTVAFSQTIPGQIYMTVLMEVETLDDESRIDTLQCELENVSDFQLLPDGWLNESAGWTLAGGIATANTTGKKLRTGKKYGLSRRTPAFPFRIGSTSNIISFFTDPIEGGVSAGSMIKINCSTNQISIREAFTGANNPAALQTYALGFTMRTGTDYLLELEKENRGFTVRLQDLNGPGYFETYRLATPWGFGIYPAYGYDQGAMHGCPGLMWDSGGGTGPSLLSFRHYAKGSKFPRLYILGDSITEGFGVTDIQRFAQLIADAIGVNRVHISGIGGTTPTGANQRIRDELRVMRPEFILIYLGSNPDASFESQMLDIIAFGLSIGSEIITCTVPTQVGDTASVLTFPGEHVLFDKAMTASGAGTTPVSAYYAMLDGTGATVSDGLHPGPLGHVRQFQAVRSAVPRLFQ